MSVLYLIEQGSKLRKTSKRLVVEKGGTTLLEVPALDIDHILIFGSVHISTQAISFLLESGIEVSFLSMNGRLRGKLSPVQSKNIFLRLAQYDRFKDDEFKLMTAKCIIGAKLKNQRTLLLRYQRNHPDTDFTSEISIISQSLLRVPYEKTVSSIMGLEGTGTRAYYHCFSMMLSDDFSFKRRTRHPPLDPVNALLSLGYVLITNEMAALVESTGFDPFIGFVHGLRYGRQSLPLDMIEVFRHPVIDTLVQSLINKGVIKQVDFRKESDGAVLLNEESIKRYFKQYEYRMEKTFKQKGSYTSFRQVFRDEIDSMRQSVLNREEYDPFLVR
jgi:CRISPR-associated protein Cas1